jgi:peptidyl-dipeptidase A
VKSRLVSVLAPAVLASFVVSCGGAPTPPPAPAVAPEPTAPSAPPTSAAQAAGAKPTAEDAARFMDQVEKDLRRIWVHQARTAWVNQTFITDDTDLLSASAEEENMEYLGRVIQEAKRFDGLDLPPDLARKLHLLKIAITLPAPSDAAKRAELANVEVTMQSAYGKGKYCPPRLHGKCLALQDLEQIMAKSRKWDELVDAWTGWHSIAPPIREKFRRYVELGNEGAREIGFSDMGALWRSGYDMPPEAFEQDTERLWQQVKPLYDELHCYVRAQLRKAYPNKFGAHDPIPAQLLGNMWAQEWGNIYPLVEPYKGQPSLDVTKGLVAKKFDEQGVVRLGEKFFVSLGLDPLPKTFWERSLFKKPADRDVVCHASAWDVTYDDDLRIKMCVRVNEEDLVTVHHELGHDYYFHAYHDLPILFQQGANDGFHEGIGDTLALSVTPEYLKSLGLIDKVPDNDEARINFLMKQALDKVAFLPFGLLIDRWRWDIFSGKVPPEKYNEAWWALRQKYQGIAPPVARSEKDFDPGAKYHVPANTPYVRYFLARIYQFQFHRALCRAAGHTGPLSTCSIHGSKEAGKKLEAMLEMGASKPWPEAMKAISGEDHADAGALLEYFEPLRKWLAEQNKGQICGW